MDANVRKLARTWKTRSILVLVVLLALAMIPVCSHALPVFARQTGQNCVACHAGGQFPELTAYGRLFKLTGYTVGARTLPLAAMGVVSASDVRNTSRSDDPSADFQKNDSLIFASASVFAAGKITDNLGAFLQVTYDNYAKQGSDGSWRGHTSADNMDIRYADRFIDADRDLIFGVSANNNPSVADPWNSAAAWMQYVPVPSPTSSAFIDGAAPYTGFAAGGNIAGVTGYAFWKQTLYVEAGGYRSATGIASFMSAGVADGDKTRLQGTNPYWRVALSHTFGAHDVMVGLAGMSADIYDDPLDTSDPATVHRFRDIGVDAQYQYILDPHAATVQIAYMRDTHHVPAFLAGQPVFDVDGRPLADTNASDRTNVFRAKASYTYEAKYGGSLSFFNQSGTTDSALYDPTPVFGNVSGNPGIRGWTTEVYFIPVQYLRIGLQYTMYDRYNGASRNYDGAGRNASDNDSLFLYFWGAY